MLKGRQMMGVRSKETLKLGGYIFTSFLLATVQNHEGEGSGPVPASPSPRGVRCKIQKESQIQHGGGVGDSIHCGLQGQALLTASHSHPKFSKIQIAKIYNPSGLLTKIKYQVPNKPRVRRQLENQGQSHGKGQVKTGREHTEVGERLRKEIAGDGQKTSRDSQKRYS